MLCKYLKRTLKVGHCLEWTGCLNSDGYPRVGVKGNSNIKVHREVFFLCNRFYPKVVRHSCDNITCINPLHLLAGTEVENMQDRRDRGRTHNHVSKEEIDEVYSLLNKNLYQKDIAKELGIKMKRVNYIVANYIRREV
tara:strand:+ start:277 stop:690 length:414 start_codon:yes stop_codon:yes gene_type:complete